MSRAMVLAVILAAAALAPSAQAADPGFASRALVLAGDVDVDAPTDLLYIVNAQGALAWEAVAGAVEIDRRYSNLTRLPGGAEVVGDGPGQTVVHAHETYAAARLTSGETRRYAALLAEADADAMRAAGGTGSFLDVRAETDPVVRQDAARVEVDAGESVYYGVEAALQGAYVNLSAAQTTYELRGTFRLQLFDVDYTVIDADGAHAQRTGSYQVDEQGLRHRHEIHTLTLRDAVLVLHTAAPTAIYARAPVVDVDGTVRALDAVGVPSIGGAEFRASDTRAAEWQGRATLALSPADGLVSVREDERALALGAMAAPVTRGPLPFVLGIGALAAALAVAFVLVRRNRREDASLEAALLAMEQRKWEVALDHLERLLAQGPVDPLLLVDRAICYEETGRFQQARESCEAALQEAPGNAEAHYYYARVLARLRMSTTCLAHLSRALALDERLTELARKEPAFDAFRDHPQFLRLLSA